MKFAHSFSHALESEGFPLHWVRCAISYRQLKKCINRVRRELGDLGLRPEVIDQLWLQESEETPSETSDKLLVGIRYSFPEPASVCTLSPRLTFFIDSNGNVLPQSLSAEFRDDIFNLLHGGHQELSTRVSALSSSGADHVVPCASQQETLGSDNGLRSIEELQISLRSDSEFFRTLEGELSTIHNLQERETLELDSKVMLLRDSIVKATTTGSGRSRSALYAWREIFRLYTDLQVFFSTTELDSGERTAAMAHQQLVKFQSALLQGNRHKKLGKKGQKTLETFLSINFALLQNLKFHEINRIALRKILKKFDKRTALRANPAIPLLEPLVSQNVAKVLCQTISQELLSVVPQLNDYLCPICLNIAFKPVRLKCNHVFCIRCLVVMQQAKQNQCALCRENVVMEATGENLDKELLAFLCKAFPKEAKAKQKENEKAAAIDIYGSSYDTCSVM